MADEDEPLDPQIEALRVRLMRLMRGGLIFGIGALVLVVALVYRFGPGSDSAPVAVARDVPIAVPAGAELVGTAVGSDRLALTLRMPDGRTVIQVVDTGGRLVVSYRLDQ